MPKKLTYEYVKQYVKSLDYELISEEYKDNKQKLILIDIEGYLYFGNFATLIRNKLLSKFHKSNPYTINNIKLWLKLNNSDLKLISNEYYNNKSKLIFKDDFGYLYFTHLNSLTLGFKPEKFHPSNPYAIQNINLWCEINNKMFKLISEKYLGSDKKLQWKCLKEECSEIFEASWENVYSGNNCGVCIGRQVGLSNCLATKNPQLAKEWHPTKNGDLTPFDVTISSGKKVWWKCKKSHEWEIEIFARNLYSECPYCNHQRASEDYNLLIINPELCKEWDYNKNKNKPEKYTPSSGKYVWWICKECKHKWYTKISSRNNGRGCPECNKSKGEKLCKEVFLINNIIEISQERYDNLLNIYNTYFIPQKEFEGLIGLKNGNLSYDFYIPKLNLLIEYHGEQHERYIPGFHKSYDNFLKQVEHDRRKCEYALNNNINLLIIWYWDFDSIEEILEKELKSLIIQNITI